MGWQWHLHALCPQSWRGCRRHSWLPAPEHGRLKQSWARGVGSSGGWQRNLLSIKTVSGSSGTSGALCRRTTTGKVWGIVALGLAGVGGMAGPRPIRHLSAGCNTQ